jgi:hypothetical protein
MRGRVRKYKGFLKFYCPGYILSEGIETVMTLWTEYVEYKGEDMEIF